MTTRRVKGMSGKTYLVDGGGRTEYGDVLLQIGSAQVVVVTDRETFCRQCNQRTSVLSPAHCDHTWAAETFLGRPHI